QVFLGEITVNQKELVLTIQAIHNYVNPASSYQFPIMNANNNQLLSFESDAETHSLVTEQVASSVTIKVIGQEGWFSDPTYELQLAIKDSNLK
ncbi:MAG: hypothetical protein OET90_05585, partial [Desulfuromonadales bacterium]|nr:hypothetical protein [Desulfuromonadales bacterium]